MASEATFGQYHVTATLDQRSLDALRAALKAAGREASNALRHELKQAGVIVQQEIQSRTPIYRGSAYSRGKGSRRSSVEIRGASGASKIYKGSHTPGLLKRSTRVRSNSNLSVSVYNNAKAVSRRWPGGYRYGKRLEFDPAYSGRFEFFYPGWDAAYGRAKATFNAVLEAAAKAFVKGG